MQITVIRKSDNSVITRIFEDEEGIKEITDDDYEVLIEKANSLADELASKLKTYGIDGNEIARTVSETIRGKASVIQ